MIIAYFPATLLHNYRLDCFHPEFLRVPPSRDSLHTPPPSRIVSEHFGGFFFQHASVLPLDEFTDYLEVGGIGDEERIGMNTVGGFAMAKIGTIPSEGRRFEWRGLRIEVLDMEGRRVDKVLVTRSSE